MAKSREKRRARAPPRRAAPPALVRLLPVLAIVTAFVVVGLGTYIRLVPALKHGYELQGDDSWEAFWVARYLVENGLHAWFRLDRSNPDTLVFWYPWGQDFKTNDYPLLHMFNAVTYPVASALGLSVKQWVAVTPAIFGGLMVFTGFLLVRRLAGDVAALVAAVILAFAPGTLERTVSTFAEKQGMSVFLLFLGLYFLDRTLETGRLRDILACGVSLGLLGWAWGGYQAIYAMIGLSLALVPVFYRPPFKAALALLVALTTGSVIALASTTVTLDHFYKGSVGILLAGGVLFFSASLLYEGRLPRVLGPLVERPRLTYALALLVLLVLGVALLVTGKLMFGERVLAMLTGRHESPLGASVAEHAPQTLSEVARKTGVAIVLAPLAVPIAIYYGRRRPSMLAMAVMTAVSMVIVFNAAYLTQMTSSIMAIASGLVLAPLSTGEARGARSSGLGVKTIALLVVAMLVLVSFIPTARAGVAFAQSIIPAPKTGMTGIGRYNNAWYYALDYIRDELPDGSVVIAWWDYGYILTVYTGKATVADGMTSNGTQIELLAKALTAQSEEEALKIIFDCFRAPPDKTYLLVFDILLSLKETQDSPVWHTGIMVGRVAQDTLISGFGDVPKSIWMLRISGRLGLDEYLPYFAVRTLNLGGVTLNLVGPDWKNETVTNTLIYRLFVNGVLSLNVTAYGPLDLSGEHVFLEETELLAGGPVFSPVIAPPLKHFKPVKVFVDPVHDSPTQKIYVAVFLFKVEPSVEGPTS